MHVLYVAKIPTLHYGLEVSLSVDQSKKMN